MRRSKLSVEVIEIKKILTIHGGWPGLNKKEDKHGKFKVERRTSFNIF
jgi:hypothetical protein